MKERGFSKNFTTAAIIVGLSQWAGHSQSRPVLKGASTRGPDNETACIEAEGEPAEDQSRLDGDEGVLNALLSHADGVPPGFVIIEGDIIVPEDFLNPVVAASYTTSIWPGGVVPYEFDANVSSATQTAVLRGMGEWAARADIEFRPRATDTAYVHVQSFGDGNYSAIGYIGGWQVLNVTNGAGGYVIAHELGHTLGYWHEQSRVDRDTYVRINYANILPGYAGVFNIRQSPGGEFGPYDFASVMHYNECAFSICPACRSVCPTITVLPPNESWQHLIGMQTGFNWLSEWDGRGMGFLYGFSGPDCNANYVRDDWDVSASLSHDCDRNGLPDECDIANGAADCTGNGMPDQCERFPDCDGSGQADFNELCMGLTPDCMPGMCEVHENGTLTASDEPPGDVSVSGDVAVVGGTREGDCPAGANCGAAYVYRFNPGAPGRWVEEQMLTAWDAVHVDDFGTSMSVDGSVAVVGARVCADPGCGSAYVYRFDGSAWVDEGRLAASDGTFNVWLASPVSVSGDVVVVGAFGDQCTAGILCGSAYVFRFNGSHWQQEQKLTASDAVPFDLFGFKVSISGNVAVVGATQRDCGAAFDCGAAYVYRFHPGEPGHWIEEQILMASDAEADDSFGYVSVSGDVAVVGAPRHYCAAGPDCGAVYIYRFNGSAWVEEAKLTASEAVPNDQFGVSVSVSGDAVVVGALGDDCATGLSCGSAYVYRYDGFAWVEEQKMTASDADRSDFFGESVSVSGDVVFVGAAGHYCSAGTDCGGAYVFGIGDCNADGVTDGCEIADGTRLDCNDNGIPDPCDIAGDPGSDCNENGIPDLCDIAGDPGSDCDGNGSPDECDIANGAADCTGNGIPDACERLPDCNRNGQADFNEACMGLTPDCCEVHENAMLTASDAAPDVSFSRVAVSGYVALVGARGSPFAEGANCDAAYVFRFHPGTPGQWVEEQKLTSLDTKPDDDFGFSVSVSGNVAVVGAHADSCATGALCGSAYVYRFDGSAWVEEQKLTALDAEAGDFFGYSVSVSGDTVVVAARRDRCLGGGPCGSAYVFRFDGSNWEQEQILTASDATIGDQFGERVSLSGNVAVVGAIARDCGAALDCGAAYVFRFHPGAPGHWIEEQQLTASDAEAGDWFGYVSVSGDVAVVGAPRHYCAAGLDCGAVYIYRFNGSAWVEEAKLTASEAAPNDRFGANVAVSGDVVVVGASGHQCAAGFGCGAAYVYKLSPGAPGHWVEQLKLTASDAEGGDGFSRVSISGDVVLVGAPGHDCKAGTDCGAAYVFEIGDCNADGAADACEIATCSGHPGCADCNSNAIPDECDQTGDFDGDGRLELTDYATFFLCRTDVCDRMLCDPPLYPVSCCGLADANFDGAIDLRDFAVFQQEFSLMP